VDFDHNGKIDAEELRVLLKKHATFTDEEIVELSELFYASRGAEGVPMEKFLSALDQAAKGSEDGRGALGLGKEFKTHPLGIGTCASEYM
jgi:Ca2+-binding EF-hand superfamily protein